MKDNKHISGFGDFNENWKDIFSPKKYINKKSKNYLDSFKKSYDERNKPENILVECLFKLEFLNEQDNRFLGAAEGVLLMEDYIKPGESFDYKENEEKFLFITYKTKETYREHIIRLIREYLTDRDIL